MRAEMDPREWARVKFSKIHSDFTITRPAGRIEQYVTSLWTGPSVLRAEVVLRADTVRALPDVEATAMSWVWLRGRGWSEVVPWMRYIDESTRSVFVDGDLHMGRQAVCVHQGTEWILRMTIDLLTTAGELR